MKEHRHLHRLTNVWAANPLYFITVCTRDRVRLLADAGLVSILRDEWEAASERHGWVVGRYVVMPDHVHFFCRPSADARTLSGFIGSWKQWTTKRVQREIGQQVPLWQQEFFDHVLRKAESYSEKWEYVRQNPVRAGLVRNVDDWPWQGEINTLTL